MGFSVVQDVTVNLLRYKQLFKYVVLQFLYQQHKC